MTMFLSKKVCDILELRKGNDMKKEEQRKTGQKETDNIALLKFREKLFLEEMEQYRAGLTGEYESILPYVRDDDGRYSEKKTCELIDELTDYARLYRKYESEEYLQKLEESGRSDEEIEELMMLFPEFGPDQEAFFRDFLYCALRISEMDMLCDPEGKDISRATQTFHDLLWFSGEHYKSPEELYVGEAVSEALRNDYADMKGIYRPASWLVHMLTGKALSNLYPEELQKEYFHYIPRGLRRAIEELGCTPSEFFRANWKEGFLSDEKLMKEIAEQVKNQFAEPEKFVECYLYFRSKRYDPRYDSADPELVAEVVDLMNIVYSLDDYVKAAVQLFTEKRGLSHLQDDDTYFTAMTLLRRAEKQLKKTAMEDRRRFCE